MDMGKSNYNSHETVKSQYNSDSNLNARIELHNRFSTNQYGWTNWVFDILEFGDHCKLLELGCGNANLWKTNSNRIPEQIHLILSDFSEGMVDAARKNLDGVNRDVQFKVVDAQDIPYDDGYFDIVIANHMLYHVPDRAKAIAEIARVLKKDGVLYATTVGKAHLMELEELVHSYDSRISYGLSTVADEFGLENGREQLKKHFAGAYVDVDSHADAHVMLLRYEDSLEVTDVEMLADFVLSSNDFNNITDYIDCERRKDFIEYLEGVLQQHGSIRITKDSGMFIVRK